MMTENEEDYQDQSEEFILISSEKSISDKIYYFLYGYCDGYTFHTSTISKILSVGTFGFTLLYHASKLNDFNLLMIGKSLVTSYVSGILYPIAWLLPYISVKINIQIKN